MIRRFRFLFILVPIAFIAAATGATMGLWNWLMPALFGVASLTFLKALGILALARLFFGGRGGGWGRRRFAFAGHRHGMGHEDWQQRMQDKWQNMDPAQRERFKDRCGKRFNFDTNDKTAEPKA